MLTASRLLAWVLAALATGICVGLAHAVTVGPAEASVYPIVLLVAAGVQALAGWWPRPTGQRREGDTWTR